MLNSQQQQGPQTGQTSERAPDALPRNQATDGPVPGASHERLQGRASSVTVAAASLPPGQENECEQRHSVDRGLTIAVAPCILADRIRLEALSLVNRYRVVRTFDIAARCFPERPFKAALTAAQRAVRELKKAGYIQPHITDRRQHVYGLTKKGADWLENRGVEAWASVRRVNDMTNPEHLLWANFIVSCCAVRGLEAQTESELLQSLKQMPRKKGRATPQGLLDVTYTIGAGTKNHKRTLRPDAVAFESGKVTWFEIDRSKRGAEREAALKALYLSVGETLNNRLELEEVVVLAKTERTHQRALTLARACKGSKRDLNNLPEEERALREIGESGIFEVWGKAQGKDGKPVAGVLGYVIVQMLPMWLPKVRIDARNKHSTAGWFSEDYLPYRKPPGYAPWPAPRSPLVAKG